MRGQNLSSVVREAEQVIRDYQGISEGITIPTWLFAGTIGIVAGVILGPAILASTAEGSAYLARATAGRIRG